MPKITHAEVRMYKMGTGDCFAIKLFSSAGVELKIMVDAGTWSGSQEKLTPFIKDLKEYMDNNPDILIITHEHKDHVHAFDVCRSMFTEGKFKADEIWMAWTEKDGNREVEKWKEDYGEKKKALGIAAQKLQKVLESKDYSKQLQQNADFPLAMSSRRYFSAVLTGFADLHLSLDENSLYKGGQAGMEVVKKDLPRNEIKYFKPGQIISGLKNLDDLKIYVLGPPELYEDIKKESGGKGESYDHNTILRESDAFGAALSNMGVPGIPESSVLPFDAHYYVEENLSKQRQRYNAEGWRKIDFDWLFSGGAFALRMNGLTNNLSLAIAIEVGGDNGRVMLFPGDAEFGSWASWHSIPWNVPRKNGRSESSPPTVAEDLLNRTVFYKVAHHLSHNGTAQRMGLEMMTHDDLVAMATLDYKTINNGWKSTMPNRAIIKELLKRTKGRLMIMNEDELYFDFNEEVPLKSKIQEARNSMTSVERWNFEQDFKSTDLYIQYKVKF